ncbi:speckle-type POZ protein-like [Mesocricetus auratus]|uniref:Speckle-type POZ protein-like n=1 Tax=Mesocricetus auratus TaxID=10036 RepID=A0ABM2X304_MESAU|nr:speckle-type POZ protein-like [Mesocricetus auratus]
MSGDRIVEGWNYTSITTQNLCCRWTISEFHLFLEEMQGCITSPTFSTGGNGKWCLRLYNNGVGEESTDYLSVFIVLLRSLKTHIWAKFQLWIVSTEGKKVLGMGTRRACKFLPDYECGFKRFILRDFIKDHMHWLLPENKITIFCKVTLFQDQNRDPGIQIPRWTMTDELGELWENSLFTDCLLVVAGQEFRAHKAILAARSPVFRAMFEHDMEESRTNHVDIHDLEPGAFKAMMGFIYTGKAPDLHNMADSVLAAADKYGLERLKVICEHALCKELTVENAAHTLFLADLHSARQLKTQALNFIRAHASEVSETSGWKTMVGSYPHLVAEACPSMAFTNAPVLEPPLKRLKTS